VKIIKDLSAVLKDFTERLVQSKFVFI
jgi:hypothetical protein